MTVYVTGKAPNLYLTKTSLTVTFSKTTYSVFFANNNLPVQNVFIEKPGHA